MIGSVKRLEYKSDPSGMAILALTSLQPDGEGS